MCFVSDVEAPRLLGWQRERVPLRRVWDAQEAALEMMERWPSLQTVVVRSLLGAVHIYCPKRKGDMGESQPQLTVLPNVRPHRISSC